MESKVELAKSAPKSKYLITKEKASITTRAAFSIPEFCAAYRFSVSMYYKQRVKGKGPRETRIGSKTIITQEDADAWLAKANTRQIQAAE